MRQRAVVGENGKALAVRIQAAHGEQAAEVIRHEVENRPAVIARMRLAGAEDIPGFVERQIDQAPGFEAQALAVDLDHICFRIGFIAKLGGLAIYAHAALFD